jgi:3-deoxy-manno-octulosonate cytidylyltransferase (CMP-KDO synthetase)
MIAYVFQRALQSGASEVVIATDDGRIADAAARFAAQVCMTSESHRSGTDRIAEVVDKLGWAKNTIVVNLQGDEPLMPPRLIDQVAADMAKHETAGVTTLSAPITQRKVLFDPHVVKVVTDLQGYALYFSRAPIPWHRDEFIAEQQLLPATTGFARHIGLYAYRAGYLKQFVGWEHAPLEQAESLEQLRVLWHGGKIHVSQASEEPGHGVDTEDDLKRVAAQLAVAN